MENTINRKKYLFALGTALILVTILTLVFINTTAKTKEATIEEDKIIHSVSALYPAYSIEELVKYSDIIAIGEIVAKSDLLEIEPVGGGDTSLFTDYVIQLNEVFKGEESKETDTVNLRMRGGENEEKIVIDVEMPKVNIGDKYLFFLVYPKTGGGYTTKDEHILLTGGPQGLFNLSANHDEYKDKGLNKAINKNNLLKLVHDPSLTKSKEEADQYYGLKQNLKTGFITQEEYDEAIKQLNEYAKIVNKK